jgi:hypothetical protein
MYSCAIIRARVSLRSQSADRTFILATISPRAAAAQQRQQQAGAAAGEAAAGGAAGSGAAAISGRRPAALAPQRSAADLSVSFRSCTEGGKSVSTGELDREVLESLKAQAHSRRLTAMYQQLLGGVSASPPSSTLV